jgi:hypothetical protein
MGDGARAAIWAEQNGMDISDMNGEEWERFFEHDNDNDAVDHSQRSRRTCPICCKKLANHAGALKHIDAVHAGKVATRLDWQDRIAAWKATP